MDPTLQATLRSLFSSAFNFQHSQKALEKALEPGEPCCIQRSLASSTDISVCFPLALLRYALPLSSPPAFTTVNEAIDNLEDHYEKEQAERVSTISEIESSWEETVRKMRERAKLESASSSLTEDLIAIGNEHMAKIVKLKGT